MVSHRTWLSGLTQILRRAGLLSMPQIERLTAYCQEHDLAPVVGMFELSLVDEPRLVRFLQSKLMIPVADAAVLGRIEAATLSLIPAELAWTYAVVPVSVDEIGNLTLAMADPTDLRAVSTIATHTGAYLVRAVSPVSQLRDAVQRHYGPRPADPKGPPTPLEIPAVGERPPRRATRELEGLEPLSAQAVGWVLPRLLGARDRDELTEVLLDFLARGFDRVILFLHLRDQLQGRDARGSDLVREAVTQVRIPARGSSMFADVIADREPRFGPWPTERSIDRAFAQAFGRIEGPALLLPIRLRDKVPIVVFASGANGEIDGHSLVQLAEATSGALERMIYQRKTRVPAG